MYAIRSYYGLTLESLVNQTALPSKVVVVNDNSTDNTEEIVNQFSEKYPWISIVNNTSEATHLPSYNFV